MLTPEEIERVRAAILCEVGPEKYNTLVRQYSEAVERRKLRFWQQELFDNYVRHVQSSFSAFELYTLAFKGAESVAIPEKPFVYPIAPEDALCPAISRSDSAKIQECFRSCPEIVERLASQPLPTWVMCEAGKHASPDIVRLLANLGCELNQADTNHFSGLCWAVAYGRHEVAATFLKLGADPNRYQSLFKIFSAADSQSMARLLIGHGADPSQTYCVNNHMVDLPTRSIDLGRLDLAEYFQCLGVRPIRLRKH